MRLTECISDYKLIILKLLIPYNLITQPAICYLLLTI